MGIGEQERCRAVDCDLVFLKTSAGREFCSVNCRNRTTYWRNRERISEVRKRVYRERKQHVRG